MGLFGASTARPFQEGDNSDRTPQSTYFRRGFKAVIAAGLLYGGYRLAPRVWGGIKGYSTALAKESPIWRSAVSQFGAGEIRGGLSTLGRGIAGASFEDVRWAAAPARHWLGVRQPDITHDVVDTARILTKMPGGHQYAGLFRSAWQAANTTATGPGPRHLLLRDVLNLPRASPYLKPDYWGKGRLQTGLRRIKGHLRAIEGAQRRAVNPLPAGTFESMLDVPVDRGILFNPATGKISDLRSLDPRHWALDIFTRLKTPAWMTQKIPSWVPVFGGRDIQLGGSRPLAWLSQLFAPTELLRRQPVVRALTGIRGALGKEQSYLYLRGNVHRFSLLNALDDTTLPREVFERGPLPELRDITNKFSDPFYIDVDPTPMQQGVRIASAGSPVGRGIRIRTDTYEHSLKRWFDYRGIKPDSITGRIVTQLDKWGVGPHLTSPIITRDLDGRLEYHTKKGALEQAYDTFRAWSHGRPAPLPPPAIVAGEETASRRFVTYAPIYEEQVGRGTGFFLQGMSDWANYSVMRPMYLLEEALGIGMKGGRNAIQSLGLIGRNLVLPTYLGFQTLRYADYIADKILPGPSPSDVLFDSYANAQVARAEVLQSTGIAGAASSLEATFPGLISSPLSAGLRGISAAYLGARTTGLGFDLLRKIIPAFGNSTFRGLSATAAAILAGGAAATDPRDDPEKLRRVYSGEDLVPIRRSRWWELGRDSLYGRDIMYYRPHWIAMRRNRVWETSIYGSEANYWKYGTISPSSWMGLRPLLNPYFLENYHGQSRPYPEASSMFGEIPIIGPLMEATLGWILKPPRQHPLLEEAMASYPERWSGDRGLPRDVAARLGLPAMDIGREGAISRHSPSQVLGDSLRGLQDWLGMQGFLVGSALETITGDKTLFGSHRRLETADRIASTERWFYGLEMGGGIQTLPVPGSGLVATELTRRLIPHRDRQIELVNPIPNTMPSWLPGPRSEFAEDRDYFVEGGFHLGDPYTKVPHGEVRLPGPGYEAIHKLHGGTQYSPVDRFLILEDVAPFTKAAKFYRESVEDMMKAGQLNDYWSRKVLSARMRKEEKMRSKDLGTPNLYDAPGLIDVPITIKKVTSPTTFQVEEYPHTFQLAGVETSFKKLVNKQLEELNTNTYRQAEANVKGLQKDLATRLKSLVGQRTTVQIAGDEAARYANRRVLAIVPGISQDAYSSPLGATNQPGLSAYLRAGPGTRLLANAYYGAVTTEPPDPLFGWLKNKLLPIHSPSEDYLKFQVLANRFGAWETPYKSYVRPWLRQAEGFFHDYVPDDLEERREAEQSFENIQFLKAVRNMSLADKVGDEELRNKFLIEAKRTYLGANPRNPLDAVLFARSAMQPGDRDYVNAFKDLTSTEERKRVLSLLPESSQYILTNLWRQKMPAGVDFNDEDLSLASRRYNPYSYPQEQVEGALASTELPEGDWPAWDPRVSVTAAKIKWIENQADDVHNYGLWESDARRVRRQVPDLPVPDLSTAPVDLERIQRNLTRLGMNAIDVRRLTYSSSQPKQTLEVELQKGERRVKGYDNEKESRRKSKIYNPERA